MGRIYAYNEILPTYAKQSIENYKQVVNTLFDRTGIYAEQL